MDKLGISLKIEVMIDEAKTTEERVCLQCGKPLLGRVDQKYCDAQCRNAFHNQNKRLHEQYMIAVNARIRSNRRILKDLCPEGKTTVRKSVLLEKKYDFRYFSGIYKSPANITYYLCYDYGFGAVKDNGKAKALIIQKQNYMDRYEVDPWEEQESKQ